MSSVHPKTQSLNLSLSDMPVNLRINNCGKPHAPPLLVCEDYLDIHLLVFKIGRQLASADFSLKSALFVQNNSDLMPSCENKGEQDFTLSFMGAKPFQRNYQFSTDVFELTHYVLCFNQCDQIGRFFAFWASIQSRWQQLFYPNCSHCQAIFVKVSKSFIFLVKSFLGNF